MVHSHAIAVPAPCTCVVAPSSGRPATFLLTVSFASPVCRFKKLFGGKPAAAAAPTQPTQQASTNAANKTISAIQNLTDHEESLEKRKSLVEKRIDAELEKAKEFTRLKKKAQVRVTPFPLGFPEACAALSGSKPTHIGCGGIP